MLSIGTGRNKGMKLFLQPVLLVLFTVLVFYISCRSQTPSVTLGQEFQLSPGGQAYVAGENLLVEFVKVTQDSRCPKGAECIQTGQVVSLLHLTRAGSDYEVSLTETGGSQQVEQNYLDYHFVFNVLPYPEVGKEIRPENYRLFIKVTRAD